MRTLFSISGFHSIASLLVGMQLWLAIFPVSSLRAVEPLPAETPQKNDDQVGAAGGVVTLVTIAGGYLATHTAASGAIRQFFIFEDEFKSKTDPELMQRRPKRVLTLASFSPDDPLDTVVQVDHAIQRVDEPHIKHIYGTFEGLDDLPGVLKEAQKKGPFDIIEIHTHGRPGEILLGDGTRVTAKNIEKWQEAWSGASGLAAKDAGLRFHACLLGYVPSTKGQSNITSKSVSKFLSDLGSPVLREGGVVVASQKVVSSLPGANTAIGRRIAEITSAGMNTFLRLGDLQIVKGDLGGWSMRPRGDFTRVEVAPASVKKCLNTALQKAVGN